ncbi:Gfo/Idh/MocA family protein [uncultured Erythrobacter sp.]|uniref:Gfo/Idh/MocA family protein n=1 Tax=uncultured Erythrobacter sp. TaxID=263913 RepID=UPI002657DB1A|nr:Gfo/Idh/MocA family oxidoreductase [uncultured Erythrobacter sp.]
MESSGRRPLRLGLVGVGKIARDQHVPALRSAAPFQLVATASHNGEVEDVPAFSTVEAMLAATELDAVSLCTPPFSRLDIARTAFANGLHVMLEKPPAATLGGAAAIAALAGQHGRTLYTTWHSRKAAGVKAAADWCRRHPIRSAKIVWHENIRQWHPGQDWIMAPGGFGVFDTAINALSIVTAILPEETIVHSACLYYPGNCAAPISAVVKMRSGGSVIDASFDFLQKGEPTWTITLEADDHQLVLSDGGATLHLDGGSVPIEPQCEYAALYHDFAELIAGGRSDVDLAPLRLVADMLLIGDRQKTEDFEF